MEAGLKGDKSEGLDIAATTSRIEVVRGEHSLFLAGLAQNAFDVIYFDPMFRYLLDQPVIIYAGRAVTGAR